MVLIGGAQSRRAYAGIAIVLISTLALTSRRDPSSVQGELDAYDVLTRLRAEPWAIKAERQLEDHAYVRAAEAGTLTLAQRRAFVGEQYSVQASDAR